MLYVTRIFLFIYDTFRYISWNKKNLIDDLITPNINLFWLFGHLKVKYNRQTDTFTTIEFLLEISSEGKVKDK